MDLHEIIKSNQRQHSRYLEMKHEQELRESLISNYVNLMVVINSNAQLNALIAEIELA